MVVIPGHTPKDIGYFDPGARNPECPVLRRGRGYFVTSNGTMIYTDVKAFIARIEGLSTYLEEYIPPLLPFLLIGDAAEWWSSGEVSIDDLQKVKMATYVAHFCKLLLAKWGKEGDKTA